MPDEWAEHVGALARADRRRARDGGAPDDVERYFLLPDARRRVADRARPDRGATWRRRSARPSGTRTGSSRTTSGRRRSSDFCRALLADERVPGAISSRSARRVAAAGERSALGQLVLKLTAPGVPDIYQGDELAFRALVDPDNRRPVDWDWREAMLRRLMGGAAPDPRDSEAVRDDAAARAPRAPARAVRRHLRAARRRPRDVRVRARRRCARGRHRPERPVEGTLEAPRGQWRDVLRGEERSFDSRTPCRDIVGEHGIAVLERL